jgi:glutamyl-tRNA synthetase
MPPPRTRLAPSPTGALHLGNLRTFLVNWALARQQGWEIVLRIENLDGPRIKSGAAEETLDILRWVGIDWDEGPLFQSHDLSPYRAALSRLARSGDAYPCRCTRKQIAEASRSAPHGDEHELRYPGTCRPQEDFAFNEELLDDNTTAWRFRTTDADTHFVDAFAGAQAHNVAHSIGDFLIGAKGGTPGYQLAVVVDDARQGIDQVVRGDDLLSSTPRQLVLYERLGLGPIPTYTHLPLVVGEDGRRLAKRHGDTRVSYYREQDVPRERLLGLLAEWCGIGPRCEVTIPEFLSEFVLERLAHRPVVFTAADDAWLLQDSK